MNTVDVRKPDVRFSALSKTLRFPNTPDFRHCLLTGHKRPVFGRPVPMLYMLQTGRYIEPDVRKPDVISSFQTFVRSETSENRTFTSGFQMFCTKTGLEPVLVQNV